jgi:hypothetical protein
MSELISIVSFYTHTKKNLVIFIITIIMNVAVGLEWVVGWCGDGLNNKHFLLPNELAVTIIVIFALPLNRTSSQL